ncbi:hypothetical protein E2C01_098518 [Portunus trituberculatus]|uniref:Uncharacterized protein n=1 Tax=Portunus trituberculatus TaxID=210409 RepID=A0A5B7KD44_PORTR|nr:hypothetical protein [Portunus trituberculatus]
MALCFGLFVFLFLLESVVVVVMVVVMVVELYRVCFVYTRIPPTLSLRPLERFLFLSAFKEMQIKFRQLLFLVNILALFVRAVFKNKGTPSAQLTKRL